ncbi:hypothetical protein ACPA54_34650 [Uniformispora flossi]|uniref:hypothetical protein n=1 Tax=Uniformispora flossi TaxID=3390723 RepID=UPI003C2CFBFC
MDRAGPVEARIEDAGNILVAPLALHGEDVVKDFFGSTITPEELVSGSLPLDLARKTVSLCGDVSGISDRNLRTAARVFVVRELAHGYREEAGRSWTVVGVGRVPIRVHGAGVYYRRFFDPDADYFGRIVAEHAFQSLTESTKPGTARRRGIYLTPVTRNGDGLHFRLLRCSTNLSGPTEGFRPTDTHIVEALNSEAAAVFRDHAPLNHVLAQIYHNTPAAAEGNRGMGGNEAREAREGEAKEAKEATQTKQSKAKISAHADKTKDMPGNGIMAFCTFYDRLDSPQPSAGDAFDYGVKGAGGLTRLRFRLKGSVGEGDACAFPAQFTLTLYPGSVFFMPLSTNRLYTHEIRPPAAAAELLPTRLGYVVRCSSTEAVHRDGRTFLKQVGGLVELEPPTPTGMEALRGRYAEENRTASFVDYGDEFLFSMNAGDYLAPRP